MPPLLMEQSLREALMAQIAMASNSDRWVQELEKRLDAGKIRLEQWGADYVKLRSAIEALRPKRSEQLCVHEVVTLFGLSETRLTKDWLRPYRAEMERTGKSDRFVSMRTGDKKRATVYFYRLDDMRDLRKKYQEKLDSAEARAAEARYGPKDQSTKKQLKNKISDLERLFKDLPVGKTLHVRLVVAPFDF